MLTRSERYINGSHHPRPRASASFRRPPAGSPRTGGPAPGSRRWPGAPVPAPRSAPGARTGRTPFARKIAPRLRTHAPGAGEVSGAGPGGSDSGKGRGGGRSRRLAGGPEGARVPAPGPPPGLLRPGPPAARSAAAKTRSGGSERGARGSSSRSAGRACSVRRAAGRQLGRSRSRAVEARTPPSLGAPDGGKLRGVPGARPGEAAVSPKRSSPVPPSRPERWKLRPPGGPRRRPPPPASRDQQVNCWGGGGEARRGRDARGRPWPSAPEPSRSPPSARLPPGPRRGAKG